MKLFLLRLIKDFPVGYDNTTAIIVRTENETDARVLSNTKTQGGDEHIINPNCWLNSEVTSCEEITTSGVSQVILKSASNGL
jgi:hypothetical protein